MRLLLMVCCFWTSVLLGQLQTHPLTIGQQHQFHSTILGEERQLNVYLPTHYHPDSSQKYPVIYVLDGGLEEDFLHISGLTQFGSMSWINLLPEVIVVGIVNIDRKRDFTFPTTVEKDQQDFPTTGQSAPFIQFIKEELQPLINKTYPTTGQNTLLGQSLGGLVATQILLEQPDLFDQYIIVSPSLWWDAQSLLKKTPIQAAKAPAVYIAVGKEGPIMQRTAKQLYKKMKALPLHQRAIHFKYFPKNDHGDVLHLATYHAFDYLFPSKKE